MLALSNGCSLKVDIKYPLRTLGGAKSGQGQPSREIFDPTENYYLTRPTSKKNIALAFLKAAWLQVPYWVHFTFKVWNLIYMCTSK